MERDNAWKKYTEEDINVLNEISEDYKDFISNNKTERECTEEIIKRVERRGFRNLDDFIDNNIEIHSGDKIYVNNMNKSVALFVIGSEPITKGMNILGAHIDSPRLDIKANPLYEDTDFAYLDTHYYGGIKKYQWTSIPLSMHGVVVKPNSEKITINIGEDESDPIFTITDLLPHLAMEQMEKKLKEGISGEDLNLLIGSIPYNSEKESEKVKLNILNILNQKYNITETDFLSSELEIVPAFKARHLGFDSSMVAGYGQDDRVCSYCGLMALMSLENVKNTAVCILSDKEEIGSMGNTGMESHMFDFFISELLNKTGENKPNLLDKVFCFSKMLSADVDAGFDPIYASVSEKNNSAFLGKGVGLNKYTGSRGKSGASDANAEYVAWIRNLLESNEIKYQISELGRVDVGGGGTIAYILANKGVDVIDCGVPVLSMHAPYEVTSKYDIYSAFKTYKAFWEV